MSVGPDETPAGHRPGSGRTGDRVAALDVGTNTVRLLVADLAPGGALHPRRYALRITRLGGGAGPAGLAPAAIGRTVAAMAEFTRILREEGVVAYRAVATSAAREAPNREALIARAREAAGIELEVISGEEEAALAMAGVRWALARRAAEVPGRFVLVDVGGGSTEVVLAERRPSGDWRDEARSLPLGAVRLVEGYLRGDPPAPAELARMEAAIEAGLPATLPRGLPVVGTAGTITTLAAMDLGLATYDRERVEGHLLSRPALEARFAQLVAMPAAARLALPGLERGREDLIVAGLAIALATMRRLGADRLRVADAGLLEGVCLGQGPGRGRGSLTVQDLGGYDRPTRNR